MTENLVAAAEMPIYEARGAVFVIPSGAMDKIDHYLKRVTSSEDRRFLVTLVELATQYGQPDGIYCRFDTPQLQAAEKLFPSVDIATSRSSLNVRLRRLCALGIFEREECQESSTRGRRSYEYRLLTVEDLLVNVPVPENAGKAKKRHNLSSDYRKTLKESREQIISMDAQLLEAPKNLRRAHSERLLNNVFFSCGRMNSRDPRRDKIISTYKFAGEDIIITATGGSAPLFSLDDQNTVLAIITLIILSNNKRQEEGKQLRNDYYLDVTAICSLCGLTPDGGNRKTVRDSIERLYHSNLNIVCPPGSKFASYFGLNGRADDGEEFNPDNMDLRFLVRRDSVSMEGAAAEQRHPRRYRIALHPLIYQQLCDPSVWSTYVINPGLLRCRQAMVNHLYFFAARSIHKDPTIVRSYPIHTLQKLMVPALGRFDNWQRNVFNDLKNYAKETNQEFDPEVESILDLFGYAVKISPDAMHGHTFTFWFNPKDPFLGAGGLIEQLKTRHLPPGTPDMFEPAELDS